MFVIEFGPVGIFFIAYYLSDFITAAAALGVTTFITLILSQLINKRVPWFALFSGSVTILTAYITYLYTAPWVLILKDSIYYFLFAALLSLSIIRHTLLFKLFFGHIFAISDTGWRVLERRWLLFFIAAGVSNEFVRTTLTTADWVVYKQIIIAVFLFFGLYQFRVSSAYRIPDESDRLGLRRGH